MRNLGFVLVCVTLVFLAVIYVKRASGLHLRIISEIAALYIIQVIVVVVLPLPQTIPGFIMIPISLADTVLVLAVLHLLDNLRNTSGE